LSLRIKKPNYCLCWYSCDFNLLMQTKSKINGLSFHLIFTFFIINDYINNKTFNPESSWGSAAKWKKMDVKNIIYRIRSPSWTKTKDFLTYKCSTFKHVLKKVLDLWSREGFNSVTCCFVPDHKLSTQRWRILWQSKHPLGIPRLRCWTDRTLGRTGDSKLLGSVPLETKSGFRVEDEPY